MIITQSVVAPRGALGPRAAATLPPPAGATPPSSTTRSALRDVVELGGPCLMAFGSGLSTAVGLASGNSTLVVAGALGGLASMATMTYAMSEGKAKELESALMFSALFTGASFAMGWAIGYITTAPPTQPAAGVGGETDLGNQLRTNPAFRNHPGNIYHGLR